MKRTRKAVIVTTGKTVAVRDPGKNDTSRKEMALRPVGRTHDFVPATIVDVGRDATKRFLTFFTDNIRNKNTRSAYHRAACRFFDWCEAKALPFERVESFHVSAYVEELLLEFSKPSVKQHLAAIRMLYDWLVVGQVIGVNPAAAVRGPKHSLRKGKTPILDEDDARTLIESIDTSNVVGLRDRAVIAIMVYSFARIEAVCEMNVRDYYANGKRWWIRLHEKGGKDHEMPAHHKLEEYLDAYRQEAELSDRKKTPLFQTTRGQSRKLTGNRFTRIDAWRMIRRRAESAGVSPEIGNHTMRGTGITNYMKNGGSLAEAQKMAGHADPRTTKLYDRSGDEVGLDEIERITI
jgi:site-specific recombinase XerD